MLENLHSANKGEYTLRLGTVRHAKHDRYEFKSRGNKQQYTKRMF